MLVLINSMFLLWIFALMRLCVFLFLLILSTSLSAGEQLKFFFTYEGKAFEQIIEKFSQQHNIAVDKLWADQSDLRVKLLALIEQGNAPDVVFIPADHTGLHKLMKYSAIEQRFLSANSSAANANVSNKEGDVYGIPVIQGNHLVLYYNKRFIDKPAATWQELIDHKKAFTLRMAKEASAQYIAWPYYEMYWFAPFWQAYGGSAIEAGKPNLNTAAMIQGLTFYKALLTQGIPDKACDYNCAYQQFTDGELAYTINGDWAFKAYKEKLGDNLGVASLPAINETTPLISYYSTHTLAFPNNSLYGDKQAQLIKLIKFFQSEAIQKLIWQSLEVLPVHEQVMAEIKQNSQGEQQNLIKQLTLAKAMPTDSEMSFIWSAMRKGFMRYQAGVLTAEQAAALMDKIVMKQQASY